MDNISKKLEKLNLSKLELTGGDNSPYWAQKAMKYKRKYLELKQELDGGKHRSSSPSRRSRHRSSSPSRHSRHRSPSRGVSSLLGGPIGLPIGNVGLPIGNVGLPIGNVGFPIGNVGLPIGNVGFPIGTLVPVLRRRSTSPPAQQQQPAQQTYQQPAPIPSNSVSINGIVGTPFYAPNANINIVPRTVTDKPLKSVAADNHIAIVNNLVVPNTITIENDNGQLNRIWHYDDNLKMISITINGQTLYLTEVSNTDIKVNLWNNNMNQQWNYHIPSRTIQNRASQHFLERTGTTLITTPYNGSNNQQWDL